MRVRVLTTIACPLGTWYRGDAVDLPEEMAAGLIRAGAAESLAPKPPKSAPPAPVPPPEAEPEMPAEAPMAAPGPEEAAALETPPEAAAAPRPRKRGGGA